MAKKGEKSTRGKPEIYSEVKQSILSGAENS